MTVIIGVDPAARRLDAVVLYDDGSWELHKRTMPTGIVDRCVIAQRWLEAIVKDNLQYGPVVCGVEEPVVGQGGGRAGANGALPLAKVHGALLAASERAGATTLPINNKVWKRRIIGNGNVNKPGVNIWVKRHWPKLWREANGRQDTCDAACIALEVKRVLKQRAKFAATRRRAAAEKGVRSGR